MRTGRCRNGLPFHGGNKLAQGGGNPLRAVGGIAGGQRSQRCLGWFNLSHAQQQAGIINPLGVGAGLRPDGYLASATNKSPELKTTNSPSMRPAS